MIYCFFNVVSHQNTSSAAAPAPYITPVKKNIYTSQECNIVLDLLKQ